MRPLRVFMCEDEDISAKINRVILLEYMKSKKINIDFICHNGYKKHNDELLKQIDLAILDIDLGDSILNGIELAKRMQKLNPYVVIIFVTAHEGFALLASQIHLSGFLQKPVDPYDFQDVLTKAIAQIMGYQVMKRNSKVAVFNNGKVNVREKEIISIEKILKTDEVKIITPKEEFRTYDNIKDIEKELSDNFTKLNRSVIVNLSYISSIDNNIVTMKNESSYTISTRQMKSVTKKYTDFVEGR